MITPKEYLDNNLDVIPCQKDSRKPVGDNWQTRAININDFQEGHNIGLRLGAHIDIDFDNPLALNFINYLAPSGAVFGKGDKEITHLLFKGSTKKVSFVFPEELSKWSSSFADPHENTIIENRSGKGFQSIVPGSVVEGKEVKWKYFETISPYPNNTSIDDCGKVALATALLILYPTDGNRDEFCFAIGGVLARYTKWTENQIDEFIYDIATAAKDEEARARGKKGTHAKKQIEAGAPVMGFPKLLEILSLDDAKPLYDIFGWVGVKPPNKHLAELRKDHVFILNSASMYNVKNNIENKKDDFNNINLFKFSGGKDKDYAFQSLMKDYDFQERILIGRACLPGHPHPIAEIDNKHLYLKPGRYLNLYSGNPFEPVKGDVSDWVDTYKRLLGNKRYQYVEQYLAAMFQKIFKHLLTLTEEEDRAMTKEMKIQWGILLVGPEGTGKKALARTVSRLIGGEHVDTNATYEQMISNHSEVIYNQLFVCINEVVTTGAIDKKVEISNKLKNFWTDEDTKINPKHIRPFRYWNNTNGICFSNQTDCLYMSNSSRRYLVIHQDILVKELQRMEDDGSFKKLYEFVNSDRIAHLFHYFLYEVKIKDWKLYNGGRAPITEDLKVMQDEGEHPTVQRLQRALDQGSAPFNFEFLGFITLDAILDFLREKWKIPINEKYIKDWLSKVGFLWKNGKKTRQMFHPILGRPRVHLLWDEDYLRDMSEGELGQHHKTSRADYENKFYQFSVQEENTVSLGQQETYEQQEERRRQRLRDWLLFYHGPKGTLHSSIKFQAKLLEDYLVLDGMIKRKNDCYDQLHQVHVGDPAKELNAQKLLAKYKTEIGEKQEDIRTTLKLLVPDKNLRVISDAEVAEQKAIDKVSYRKVKVK